MKGINKLGTAIMCISMLCLVGCSNTSNDNSVETTKEVRVNSEKLVTSLEDTVKIEIYNDKYNSGEDIKPTIVTDKNIIDNFISFMNTNVDNLGKTESGGVVKDKIVFYGKNNSKITLDYVYDDLYEFGYILDKEKRYDLPYDFFRLLVASNDYKVEKASVKEDVKDLFSKYKYTPSFMISSEKFKLPNNLKYGYDENIDKLYWAYCMELSKAIGMDFSNLLSKEITAEMYYLLQPLPSFAKPYTEARGIVIRHNGKIVGGYIQGNNNLVLSTLNRQRFEEVKYISAKDWVYKNIVDKDSELYKETSKMSDETLIKTYYESMANGDYEKMISTMDIQSVFQAIMSNNSKTLFTKDIKKSLPGYIKKLEIIDIKESQNDSSNYDVELDIVTTNDVTVEKGRQTRTVIMSKEDGISKIKEEVPGPQ